MASGISLKDFCVQGDSVQGLLHTLDAGTFVHAYLISGMEGVGKKTLAGLVTQYLLCKAAGENEMLLPGLELPKAEKPCGVCSACRQVLSGTHPDVIRLGGGTHLSQRPEDAKKAGIVVNDIREVIRLAGTHSFEGGRRVVQLDHAEQMNAQAQNALLKTLEEPLEGTVFLLLTDRPSLLLPTIVSRCRHVKLHAWPDGVVQRALEARQVPREHLQEAIRVSGGSIGRALELAGDEAYWQRRASVMQDFFALDSRSDILRVSSAWKDKKEQAGELLDDVEDLLHTLLLVRTGRLDAGSLGAYPQAWQRMAMEAALSVFMRLLDAVSEARRLKENQVTLQAVLERLLLRLMEEKAPWLT